MVVVTAGTTGGGGGGTHKVLLISGKNQQQSTGGSPAAASHHHHQQAAYGRSISVVLPPSSSSSCGHQSSDDSGSDSPAHSGGHHGHGGPPMRKRQRLTHLSPEEKALRRKLKNRVAAQTARDRKKAKMGELEQQVLDLELENQQLHVENRLLREKTSGLLTENEELRQRLGLDTLETKEKVQVLLSSEEEAGLGIGSSESAAGAGPAPPKSEDFTMDTDGPDPTDTESDLLMGILDILDPELFLKSCEQEEQQALLLVGGGDSVPAAAPAALGPPPVKLEALNELIHFDHIYTKPVEVAEEETAATVLCGGVESEYDVEVKLEEDAAACFPVTVVVEVDEETVCIKDEPEEVVIPDCDEEEAEGHPDDFISAASPLDLSGLDKEACLADAYSDSGYERSPSPFSNMSSPLCSESSWEDMFANELFPQLISV